jgi:transposase-like protein
MNTKGHSYQKSIIFQAVYFKLTFPLSCRDVQEIIEIKGVLVHHAAIQHCVYKFIPFIEIEMNNRQGRETRWRMYLQLKNNIYFIVLNEKANVLYMFFARGAPVYQKY